MRGENKYISITDTISNSMCLLYDKFVYVYFWLKKYRGVSQKKVLQVLPYKIPRGSFDKSVTPKSVTGSVTRQRTGVTHFG